MARKIVSKPEKTKKATKKEKEHDSLADAITNARKELSDIKAEEAEAINNVSTLNYEIEDLSLKAKELTEAVIERENHLSFTKDQLIDLEKNKNRVISRTRELEEKFITNRLQHNEERENLKADLKSYKDDINKEKEEEKAKLTVIKNDRQVLLNEMDNIRTNTHNLEDSIGKKESNIYNLSKNISNLNKDLKELSGVREQLDEDIIKSKELEEESNKKADEIIDLNSEIAEKLDKIKALQSEIKTGKSELKDQQDKMLSLLGREHRLNELIPKVKELYLKAGVKIEI